MSAACLAEDDLTLTHIKSEFRAWLDNGTVYVDLPFITLRVSHHLFSLLMS